MPVQQLETYDKEVHPGNSIEIMYVDRPRPVHVIER